MPRSFRRVHQLAAAAGRDPMWVIGVLSAAGMLVRTENDLVPKARHLEALRLLGLPAIQQRTPSYDREEPDPHPDRRDDAPAVPEPPKPPRRPAELRLVGHLALGLNYLSADEIERIHHILVEDFAKARDPIFPPGVKSRALLESAVGRVHTSLTGHLKYPTIPMAAAAYLHALTLNHPFHNGNKRTALVTVICFLDLNDYVLDVDQDALYDFVLQVAAHELIDDSVGERPVSDEEMNEIAVWINRHSRAVSREEKILKFHDLRSILGAYDCEMAPLRGNRIQIKRGEKRFVTGYRNEGTDMDRRTIREIREELGLTAEEGYDSAIFYAAERRIPDFILRYRRTLDRLAKA